MVINVKFEEIWKDRGTWNKFWKCFQWLKMISSRKKTHSVIYMELSNMSVACVVKNHSDTI